MRAIKARRLIFLDFDGVLTNRATGYRSAYLPCANLLNRITESTGARIVVTSCWRSNLPTTRKVLRGWGIVAPVIGLTPRMHRAGDDIQRGHEIQAWLDKHPTDQFVILDDDDDMADLLPHLVRTNGHIGLTEADAERAIALLKEDHRGTES